MEQVTLLMGYDLFKSLIHDKIFYKETKGELILCLKIVKKNNAQNEEQNVKEEYALSFTS